MRWTKCICIIILRHDFFFVSLLLIYILLLLDSFFLAESEKKYIWRTLIALQVQPLYSYGYGVIVFGRIMQQNHIKILFSNV